MFPACAGNSRLAGPNTHSSWCRPGRADRLPGRSMKGSCQHLLLRLCGISAFFGPVQASSLVAVTRRIKLSHEPCSLKAFLFAVVPGRRSQKTRQQNMRPIATPPGLCCRRKRVQTIGVLNSGDHPGAEWAETEEGLGKICFGPSTEAGWMWSLTQSTLFICREWGTTAPPQHSTSGPPPVCFSSFPSSAWE